MVATAQNNLLGEALWAGIGPRGHSRHLLRGGNCLPTQGDYRNWGFERMVPGHKVHWHARQVLGLSGRKAVQESPQITEKRVMGSDSVSGIGIGTIRFAVANSSDPPADRGDGVPLPRVPQLAPGQFDIYRDETMFGSAPPGMLPIDKEGPKRRWRVPSTSSLRNHRHNLAPTSVGSDGRALRRTSQL
jgi:hypothetical protein